MVYLIYNVVRSFGKSLECWIADVVDVCKTPKHQKLPPPSSSKSNLCQSTHIMQQQQAQARCWFSTKQKNKKQ
jgi:hypothetical protein